MDFREGDRVLRGAVLIRLETARLDNEIAKQRRAIRAGEEELAKLGRLEEALARQFEVTRAKAEAELAQAREDVRRAEEQRNSEIRLAELALRAAEDEEAPLRRLMQRLAVAPGGAAHGRGEDPRGTGEIGAGPDSRSMRGSVQVAQRALELVERDYAVKREEAELKRGTKRAEVEAARTGAGQPGAGTRAGGDPSPRRGRRDDGGREGRGPPQAGGVGGGDRATAGVPLRGVGPQRGCRPPPRRDAGADQAGRLRLPARTAPWTARWTSSRRTPGWRRKATVYTVKIATPRGEVGRGAYRGRVKLGMAGQAEIITGRESLLMLLVKRIRKTISLG